MYLFVHCLFDCYCFCITLNPRLVHVTRDEERCMGADLQLV